MQTKWLDRWAWNMAWKEARSSWWRMGVFMGSLAIAIGSIVAVNSLRDSLNAQVDRETKSLLGADMALRSNSPIPDSLYAAQLDGLIAQQAEEVGFASMAYSPATQKSRLSRVSALEGEMPFYGDFETLPAT
ncbi:hypothetical protein RZS08_43565, partial [Arthrospira platensis SPKY1]|nr:hypothetical protein [Arthrospira platensis SPKY1]